MPETLRVFKTKGLTHPWGVGCEYHLCTPKIVTHMDEVAAEDEQRQRQVVPADATERKKLPVTTGVLDYFPDALLAVAAVSKAGNDQHNPGEPLHWAKEKSKDHADCIVRHLLDRGTIDTDGLRHSAKLAWRALALLQIEIETETST